MRPHHLTITAFGPFAATERVDFDTLAAGGLFLLHGDTGAGKTSILDAVCFALYGSVPGLRPTQKLRSDHAAPTLKTQVVLEFSVAGRRLEITRRPRQPYPSTRAKGDFATAEAIVQLTERITHPDGSHTQRPIAANHQDVSREIEAALGLSKEQFCQVVLLPQGDFATFLHSSDKDRRILLSKLFGTGRFQALQAWLTARSQSAKTQLDEALHTVLRLTDRIDQAAGPAPDTSAEGETPPAPGRPDTEHLPAIALWAHALLSRARTARTDAATEDQQAGDDHTRSKELLHLARELAGHQARHSELLGDRAALDERAAQHPLLRQMLASALRAEPVRSRLNDLELIAMRLDQDQQAEGKARGLLDATWAAADAPQLELARQQCHADLGQVKALLPQADRHAGLGVELEELRNKEAAAQEEYDEALAWLEQWPALHQEHADQVAALLKAVDQVPFLTDAKEALEQRLQTARKRDDLGVRLTAAAVTETLREKEALQAKRDWLDLRERRMDGMAADLAAGLTDGAACKVCGSTVHPNLARPSADHLSREDEEAAEQASEEAAVAHTEAGAVRSDLAARHAEATGAAGPASVAEIIAQLDQANAAHSEALARQAELVPAQEALARLQQEHGIRTGQQQAARDRLTECQTRSRTAAQQREEIASTLADAMGEEPTLAHRITRLERDAENLSGTITAVQQTASTHQRHQEARDTVTDAASQAQFSTLEEAAAALQSQSDLQTWQEELEQWGKDDAVGTRAMAAPSLTQAALQPAADLTAAQAAVEAAETRVKSAAAALRQSRDRATQLEELTAELDRCLTAVHPLKDDYLLVDRLAGIASATNAANTRSMELEAYVLAARLEEIAEAANARLKSMSLDRYTLMHTTTKDTGQRGRVKAGLGLRVMDNWTGADRETSTLSGGETFTASLALALGLADVVSQEAGGRTLGTLFIDEGFGTLDEDSLQSVLEVLDQLRAGNRAVGIISHVADLRHRIPARLQVIKGQNGSVLRPHDGADA